MYTVHVVAILVIFSNLVIGVCELLIRDTYAVHCPDRTVELANPFWPSYGYGTGPDRDRDFPY